MVKRFRIGILGVGFLIFAVSVSAHLLAAFQTGRIKAMVKSGGERLFSQINEPGGFYFWVVCYTFFAILMFVCFAFSALAIFSNNARAKKFSNLLIDKLEADNPSGLKPLWIGLIIVGVLAALVVYR